MRRQYFLFPTDLILTRIRLFEPTKIYKNDLSCSKECLSALASKTKRIIYDDNNDNLRPNRTALPIVRPNGR